jgi:hypothetical protein
MVKSASIARDEGFSSGPGFSNILVGLRVSAERTRALLRAAANCYSRVTQRNRLCGRIG